MARSRPQVGSSARAIVRLRLHAHDDLPQIRPPAAEGLVIVGVDGVNGGNFHVNGCFHMVDKAAARTAPARRGRL